MSVRVRKEEVVWSLVLDLVVLAVALGRKALGTAELVLPVVFDTAALGRKALDTAELVVHTAAFGRIDNAEVAVQMTAEAG